MPEQFYSEDSVDRWCSENLPLPKHGFFVDVGCAHPFRYSQTAWLRARGWKGIAIDGDSAYAPEWAVIPESPFIHAVLSNTCFTRFLTEPTNALVSRVHEQGVEVEAHTLDNLLREHGVPTPIDFMSLDIEGMEALVLADSFQQIQAPHILVVEYNSCHKGRDANVFNVCFQKGYKLAHLTDCNAVFLK